MPLSLLAFSLLSPVTKGVTYTLHYIPLFSHFSMTTPPKNVEQLQRELDGLQRNTFHVGEHVVTCACGETWTCPPWPRTRVFARHVATSAHLNAPNQAFRNGPVSGAPASPQSRNE